MQIELKDVSIYQEDKLILENVNFHVDESEFVYIVGKVGSGKSSLLKTLYGELPINCGSAEILTFDLRKLKRKHIPELRKQLGIIFQDFQLLRDRTVGENLNFVLQATGWKKKADRKLRIEDVLKTVGLLEKLDKFPHELSGGEQQRVCIARALLNNPKIILADEPTGNLDHDTGKTIVEILRSVCEQGTSVIMITHNLNLLSNYPGIVYRCTEGILQEVTNEYNNPIDLEDQ
ncbi:MAG TPA: ATP-binding cassette domain-containing protein [Alloprevotella sp.]|nr:ATP-binding cassette domain-containing protein [Alloprevotella sp.]